MAARPQPIAALSSFSVAVCLRPPCSLALAPASTLELLGCSALSSLVVTRRGHPRCMQPRWPSGLELEPGAGLLGSRAHLSRDQITTEPNEE
jgi:hypothetical protein